jgi:alkylation response protein AidB-like acyl-CoA dehydrogenase
VFQAGTGAERLRSMVRDWLLVNTPRGWQREVAGFSRSQFRAFNLEHAARLHAAGLLVPHWPRRFGGGGFPFDEIVVIQQELVRADYPQPRLLEITLNHAAATLMTHGSQAQQAHLAAMLDGEIWCQGFSEPEAGSDLASLRTRADQAGDGFVLNGQKVWSSYADLADWCLLLARTDQTAPKHRGISLFMMDLASPGVRIRPIRQATGTEEFCEIFLTDVALPASALIGDLHNGWRIAQTTLTTERAGQVVELQARLASALESLWREAPTTRDDVRQRLAALTAEVDVLGMLGSRLAEQIVRTGEVGAEASLAKLYYSECLQRVTAAGAAIAGMTSMLDHPREFATTWTSGKWMIDHLKSWNWTIAAGSNEIQRNIIGERVLGLPREPQA